MSLFGSLLSGVQGLSAQSQDIGIISDNIANSQTVGYKENEAFFNTLTTPSTSTQNYATGGVQSNTVALIDKQGVLTATSSPTDMAITGRGFLAVAPQVNTTTGAVATTTNVGFTRAGSFTIDANGFLKSPTGQYLLGVPIPAGTATPSTVSIQPLGGLSAVNVGAVQGNAQATSTLSIGANLPASAPLTATDVSAGTAGSGSTTSSALNFTRNNLLFTAGTSGNASATDASVTDSLSSPPQAFNSQIQVFDALGVAHDLTLTYVHTASDQYQVFLTKATVHGSTSTIGSTAVPLDSVNNTSTNFYKPPQAICALFFDPSSGGLQHIIDAKGNVDSAAAPTITFNPTSTSGATTVSIAFNPGAIGTTQGITQYSSTFAVGFQNQNGVPFGYRTGVSIDTQGIVRAVFTNGQSLAVSRVPLVTFANADALMAQTPNTYQATTASGSATVNFANTGGAGTITTNTLEGSTVDLAQQFTALITAQSAYSANTKTIQTAQQLLNQLIQNV